MYRFAPSPTKDMRLGDLRVALFNYISSRQNNEKFIIRIEDIDKEKNIESKDREILDILDLFGIRYDQLLYQSENLKFHRQLASKLLMDGNAFSCFCTPEIIKRKKEKAKKLNIPYLYDGVCKKLSDTEVIDNENPFVVRAKKPISSIEFSDIIKGKIDSQPEDIDDFVILKVDKTPTYNFACAIDDMLTDIKLIIRDEKYLQESPKQELIREYLGYSDKIEYAHLPTIQNDTKSIKWFLEEGFLPSAIINYLITLGNDTQDEIFTLDEAIEWFNIGNISQKAVEFDMKKLKELNKEHIKRADSLELSKFLGYSSRDIGELAKIYLDEASTINEIKAKIDKIFSTKTFTKYSDEFNTLKSISKDMPYFKEFDEFIAYLQSSSNLKKDELLLLTRVLLTGYESGPDLYKIYPYIKNYLGEIIK